MGILCAACCVLRAVCCVLRAVQCASLVVRLDMRYFDSSPPLPFPSLHLHRSPTPHPPPPFAYCIAPLYRQPWTALATLCACTTCWTSSITLRPVEIPLATDGLLENTDGVLRTPRGAPHQCSLGAAPCYLLFMLTRAILMPSLISQQVTQGICVPQTIPSTHPHTVAEPVCGVKQPYNVDTFLRAAVGNCSGAPPGGQPFDKGGYLQLLDQKVTRRDTHTDLRTTLHQ